MSQKVSDDGDGNPVKVTQNGQTRVYIGNHVEWNVETETMTKYYYAGGQRIAMREGDTAYYPLTDHLGSTSTTLNYDGEKHSSLGYKAFGRTRYTDGDTPTQRRFTGQIQDSATGLYFYNARYYNPMLGRFIQPDTIVPEPGNPQSLNRYSYVLNNPLKYTDPTGHYECEMWCEGDVINEKDIDFGAALPPSAFYNTDPASTNQIFDHILLGGEVLVAVACEACDWGLTFYHWSQGDFHPVDIVGLAPLISASQVRVWRSLDEVGELGTVLRGCSFSEETLVTTLSGQKPISEVEIGDLVLAYNEQLGEVGIYPVTAVWSHLDPVVVKLVIDGELILTTPEHPFFISGDAWVAAGELWLGARVKKADGSYGAVEVIEVVERPQEMYNLTVDEAHTYFVGDQQWLVHNSCPLKEIAWSKHGNYRKAKKQAINAFAGDLTQATRSNIFIQDDGAYILRGPKGREYILSADQSRVVTGYPNRSKSAHRSLMRRNERRSITEEEYQRFREMYPKQFRITYD